MYKETKMLTDEQLQKLATNRLLAVFQMVRATISCIYTHYGHRCCEICNEYIGDNWEEDVHQHAVPLEEYQNRIKAILNTREHVDRTRRRQKKRRAG